ncbi:hypothetical protein JCM17204_34150 [Blautia stercoris]
MAVKQRYQEADYLNVGAGTEQYVFMGTGFTKIDDSPSAQTTSKRYVNNKSTTKSIGSYDWSAPFEMDMIESEEAVKHIVDIGRKEKTGQDAEADYVRVDLAGTKTVNGYPARKRKVAIEVAEFTDNDGEITGSGNLLGKGDWEFGFFDIEKKTFKTEAGE